MEQFSEAYSNKVIGFYVTMSSNSVFTKITRHSNGLNKSADWPTYVAGINAHFDFDCRK